MVAYSFKIYFAPQIEKRVKEQTVRSDRKRHAEIGEPVQLYTGMRTRSCHKIIPDPICIGRDHIMIEMKGAQLRRIEIAGVLLNDDDTELFARQDGFAPEYVGHVPGLNFATARMNMTCFWAMHHAGQSRFEGALIRWK